MPESSTRSMAESTRVARIREQWGDIVRVIVAACQGDADAAAQLASFLDEMSHKDDWRALIAVLRRILAGERDPMDLLPGLAEQLYHATRGMATQPNAPAGIRELGRVLNVILSGERAPDLADLPPEWADKVRGVLQAIRT